MSALPSEVNISESLGFTLALLDILTVENVIYVA